MSDLRYINLEKNKYYRFTDLFNRKNIMILQYKNKLNHNATSIKAITYHFKKLYPHDIDYYDITCHKEYIGTWHIIEELTKDEVMMELL